MVWITPREVKPYIFAIFFELSKMLLWDCLHFIQAIPAFFAKKNGGRGGIRTHGAVAHTQHFQCCAFDHSTTLPQSMQ